VYRKLCHKLKSNGKRQQCHISGTFDRSHGFSLTTGAVAAALAGINLTAIGQKLMQSPDVFVVNVIYAPSAKTALCLFASPNKARFPSIVILF
jgi:hypothetical protein